MSGLEVDEVVHTGPRFEGVVVGHVLDVRPHPDADRLRVCSVDLGDGEPIQIVCGAPNVAAGQHVPVATVGTVLMLPARDGSGLAEVTIKKGKIRGETSNGMICAEDELGLGSDHDGILVLDDGAQAGTSFADYLASTNALPGDTVLDIAITPNRPDATSHLGVARDVAALTGAALMVPDVDVPEPGGETAEQITVQIDDPEGCPRYAALIVRGVTVGPSPDWLKGRLEAIGLRPINNVVDVTNFVLHEMGQPLHAFDLALLAGNRIIVRRSTSGETLTTLDDQKRDLPEGSLLICDAEKPVAVAGVMGGANSEVSASTTDVLIESAVFDPSSVRRTAKALGLQTDASYRFERGIDPTAQARAAARAAHLLVELAGGTLVPGLVDETPRPYEAQTTTLRSARVARVLGTPVPDDEATRLLRAIGFGVEPDGSALEPTLNVTIPPFRPDVTREIDVIEEVARLYGYDRLPQPSSTPVPLLPASDTPSARLLDRARRRLAALGLRELYTNSLVRRETADAFTDAAWHGRDVEVIETLNPISQEMAALRPSLLPGMIETVAYNQARGSAALRFMEAGSVYARSTDETEPVVGYRERTALALGISGPAQRAAWDSAAREVDVYDLKGIVMDLLDDLGLTDIEEDAQPTSSTLAAYALALRSGSTRLGVLGRASDDIARTYDLQAPLFIAELDWDAIAALATRDEVTRYAPISRFPVAERDLALVVPEAQAAEPLLRTIRDAGRPLLQEARLFDLYRGDRIAEGTKSLAFSLRFGADRTLTDREIDGRVKRIVSLLASQHGAELRA